MRRACHMAAFVLAAANAGTVLAAPVGNARAGEAVYARCMACHALAYDRTGPHHCGLFGRRAGSVPGFEYSAAMKQSHIIWDAKTLDKFLSDPAKMVPGTTMGYAGVKDPQERADLIAYLKEAGKSPECRR